MLKTIVVVQYSKENVRIILKTIYLTITGSLIIKKSQVATPRWTLIA